MASTAALVASYTEMVIGVFGLFGNINILVAMYTRSSLRSKCGLLMALIAFYDTIAIGFEYFQAIAFVLNAQLTTRECFRVIFLFVFALQMQMFAVLSISVDRLVAILFPFVYRSITETQWVIYTSIPGLVANGIFLPWSYLESNELIVNGCNPPSSMPDHVALWWTKLTVAVNVAVVAIYIAVIVAIRINAKRFSKSLFDQQAKNFFIQQQKAMRTVSVMIVVICSTWFLTQAIAFVYYALPQFLESYWFQCVSELAVIPVMCGYSLNYYVYFWRSSEYRRVFKHQLRALFPFLKKAIDGEQTLFTIRSKASHGSMTH